MARVFPFQPYRYSAQAGDLKDLATQPYDKISPEMQQRYLAASPHNLVRIILGEGRESDSHSDNVYTRAAAHLRGWTQAGILARDAEAAIYPYFQSFTDPESGERLVRKGFIALGALEPYEAQVVFRHELTLSGPKRDRLELLRATRAHFGQVFMLYSDAEHAVDRLLEEAAAARPLAEATDEYGVLHQLWRVTEEARIREIQQLMEPHRLMIADGHHRYETALAFQQESGVDKLMMTFVNAESPGLRILATHRLLDGIDGFQADRMLKLFAGYGEVEWLGGPADVKNRLATLRAGLIAIGVVGANAAAIVYPPAGDVQFDVDFLHGVLLPALGITPEAVREGRHIEYVRGMDAALARVQSGEAQAAFLLTPTPAIRVMDHAFAGGVMPQKSTDFYPKLLSGMTIWKVDE